MIHKAYKIPLIYQKINQRGFFELKIFLWLNDMEWMSIDRIKEYEYDNGENPFIIPFAITGGGDKWVWFVNSENKEYPVGLCERGEINGIKEKVWMAERSGQICLDKCHLQHGCGIPEIF